MTSRKDVEDRIVRILREEFLSISDTCQLLGASRMTIYRQIKNGNINAVKLGRRTIIRNLILKNYYGLIAGKYLRLNE